MIDKLWPKSPTSMVAPGKGILAADEIDRFDHQALRIDQRSSRPRTTAATIARCCSPPPMP